MLDVFSELYVFLCEFYVFYFILDVFKNMLYKDKAAIPKLSPALSLPEALVIPKSFKKFKTANRFVFGMVRVLVSGMHNFG